MASTACPSTPAFSMARRDASASARHVIGVALGGVVRIFFPAQQWVLAATRAQPSLDAVENGDPDAERAEIDARYDGHEFLPESVGQLVKLRPMSSGGPRIMRASGGAVDNRAHWTTAYYALHTPAQVPRGGFAHGRLPRRVRRHVVLETVLADVAQQPLQVRDPHHARRRRRYPADRR